jgi:excisionase family DNA binding protein
MRIGVRVSSIEWLPIRTCLFGPCGTPQKNIGPQKECAFHGAICIVACSWRDLVLGGWFGNEDGYPARKGNDTMNRNLPRVAYRPREAAEVTGLSLRFLYYAIQHKDLPTVRVGRCRLITEKALREWLERKTEATVQTES